MVVKIKVEIADRMYKEIWLDEKVFQKGGMEIIGGWLMNIKFDWK